MTNNYLKATAYRPKDTDGKRRITSETIAFFDHTSEESIAAAQDRIGAAEGHLSIYRAMPRSFPGVPEIGAILEADAQS